MKNKLNLRYVLQNKMLLSNPKKLKTKFGRARKKKEGQINKSCIAANGTQTTVTSKRSFRFKSSSCDVDISRNVLQNSVSSNRDATITLNGNKAISTVSRYYPCRVYSVTFR